MLIVLAISTYYDEDILISKDNSWAASTASPIKPKTSNNSSINKQPFIVYFCFG